LRVSIAAQGADAHAVVAAKRVGKLVGAGGIARSGEIDEENRAAQ
jgi:hypothetical protein